MHSSGKSRRRPQNTLLQYYISVVLAVSVFPESVTWNVVNSISAPVTVKVGNVGQTQTRYFQYKYSCDQNYANCKYKEVFSLGLGIGLFDWKYYVNQNGSFQLRQESIIDQFQGGQSPPLLPCTNSYQ